MNYDHYFTIGTRHAKGGNPCEDYATSGELLDGRAYAVVSDGCSGAHSATDLGARTWAHAFAYALTKAFPRSDMFVERFLDAGVAYKFTPNPFDYLATVVGVVSDGVTATTYLFGDGAIWLVYRDGRRRMLAVDWLDNMPYYPLYARTPAFDRDFREQLSKNPLLQPVRVRTVDFVADDKGLQVQSDVSVWHDLEDFERGWTQSFNLAEEGLQAIAVATDGVEQIQLSSMLPAEEALNAFTLFKNHEGSFVKRRVMRALDEMAKRGYRPADDVGVACIWFD